MTNKKIVIACDHALPALAAHGVHPDLVFAVDGQGYIWPNLFPGVPLLAATTCDAALTFSWRGPVSFWVHAAQEMLEISQREFGKASLVIENGRTVGSTMLGFALSEFQDVEAVHLIGYDYCWFPDGKQHASSPIYRNMDDVHAMDVLASGGHEVRTTPAFLLEAFLVLQRLKLWGSEQRGTYVHGTSIVPMVRPAKESLDVSVDGTLDETINKNTIDMLSPRWCGSARANSKLVHVPARGVVDRLTRLAPKNLVLVAAGPSADNALPILDELIADTRDAQRAHPIHIP